MSDKASILDTWAEHFDNLLNAEDQEGIRPVRLLHLHGDVEPPREADTREAVEKLRNNKAPGLDGIQAEILKKGGEGLFNKLHELILKIWNEEGIPDEWRIGIICPILKKGDPMMCTNYRGITLLPVAYKVLSNILFRKILPFVEKEIGQYQCGFRRGMSTTDQLFILRQIMERTREFGINTHHLFVDFKAAYDSVYREELYRAMIEFGIPGKLIRLVRATMAESRSCVRIQGDLTNEFICRRGVRQGDGLACLLFNIALERAVRDAGIQRDGTIWNKMVQLLAYADDINIIGRTVTAMKGAFLALVRAAKKMGLTVNEEKTKYMSTDAKRDINNITIGEYTFERVQAFKYLGSIVTPDNSVLPEAQQRILTANRCYYGLSKYMKSRDVTRATKVFLYKTLIRPVLTYGSETWPLTKELERQLLVFERKVLRRIFGPVREGDTWRIRHNEELRLLYNEVDIVQFIKLGRLRWAGHVQRMPDTAIPKKIRTLQPEGRRRVGRPRGRWIDGVNADARSLGIQNWWTVALDRRRWRKLLEEAKFQQ